MTLTTRLSLFFLASLAAVLVGFSTALFLLARGHLLRQADERVQTGLEALAAVAEVEPGGVEWDPHSRPLDRSRHRVDDGMRWAVRANGKVLDASTDAPESLPLPEFEDEPAGYLHHTDARGHSWLVGVRRIDGLPIVGSPPEPNPKLHPALILTTAIPTDPIDAVLVRLAATLAGLTLGVLAVALLAARRVCRRALAPVAFMADAARSMNANDLAVRLPAARTADELADLGIAFNGLLDRLAEAIERERRFAGEASHQLRTPLAGILGQVEVALRRERTAEEYRAVLASVENQTGRLRRVIEALLFLARAESDAMLPDREVVNLAAWIPERLHSWADHPRAHDLAVRAEQPEVVAKIHPDLFGELLDALIDNAFKYSPAGSAVEVRVNGTKSEVGIEVIDRGCGIAIEERSELFRPFFRSDRSRRLGIPGSGLGLAVAARIAAALGGSISVDSELDRGSRFHVSLSISSSPS